MNLGFELPHSFFRNAATIAVSFTLSFSLSAFAGDEAGVVKFRLSSLSPILPEVGVPFLHEAVPEHRLSDNSLSLNLEIGKYQWLALAPRSEPFRLHARLDPETFDHGIFTVWNWNNHVIQQHLIDAGEPITLEAQIIGQGCYLLTLDAYQSGQCKKRLIRNIAATPDLNTARKSWKTDEFFLGICAFPGRYHWNPGGSPTLPSGLNEEEARQHEAELVARLGLQVVRVDESLEMGQRDSNDGDAYLFDFKRMDAAVDSYTSRGFELVLQTMNAADWAVLPKYSDKGMLRWQYPHQERPQRAYLAALIERYGKYARIVQISNEPDQTGYWAGSNEEFVHQYRFSREEVRAVAPEMPVTYGGLSLVDEEKCLYFLKELNELADLPAFNAHGNLTDYKRSLATMQRLQAAAGTTRIDG